MNKQAKNNKIHSKIQSIVRDNALAKFGDSLTNFIYSCAKTKALDKPFGERVYDKSLAEVMRKLDLRKYLPSSISSGEIGDGAEALIGYAYLNDLVSIDEMIEILHSKLSTLTFDSFSRKEEKKTMIVAFIALLEVIVNRLSTNNF